jgi:uncharacterized membrane protein
MAAVALAAGRVANGAMKRAPEGRQAYMGGWSVAQYLRMIRSSPRAWLARWCTVFGASLSLITVIVSALDAVSVQQAIAMALPAGMITVFGLIAMTVPDAWVAWRRGFQHGYETADRAEPLSLAVEHTSKGFREVHLG